MPQDKTKFDAAVQKLSFAQASEQADAAFAALCQKLERILDAAELAQVTQAYGIAKEAHGEQRRSSGELYIIHPVATADLLAEMGMDAETLIAALLHDVVEDTKYPIEKIKEQFGADVANLVDGVTKLGKISLYSKEEQQSENLRKMLLAMSQDIRVILIKLADRQHNMRTLQYRKEQKRRDKARETLDIYAPIAHRLGIRAIKEELEDLSISYLDPVAYDEISDSLEAQSLSRREFLDGIRSKILARVQELVPDAQVDGRIKSVHGIYRKMYMQDKGFDEIYDIYAVRIIVNSVNDCYNCLGLIHDMFRAVPGRFKDYISLPKPNGYQSLHTTLIEKEGIPFEVQIRTHEMHRTAEYGIAAHWKYKLGGSFAKEKRDERLNWVRQLIESQQDTDDVEDIVRTIKSDFVPDEVYVLTPKGDVIDLPQGATVIDFAYAIHSAVGNRMVGAKADGRIVPIDYQVKTGEIVDVLTSAQAGKGPSRDWLKIVRTSSARSKIKSWFKKERREENIVEGKMEVEREFRKNFIRLPEPELQAFLLRIAEKQHCMTVDDFYAAIGYGGISVGRLMPHIRDEYTKLVKAEEVPDVINIAEPKKRSKSSDGIVVEGIDNCLIKFSRCCNPLPGDDIIGFITRGHGVSIHVRSCSNVPQDTAQSAEPERWVKAFWDSGRREDFKATLHISCLNRLGMLADISVLMSNMHVMITGFNSNDHKDGRTSFHMTISVNGIEQMENVIQRLKKIKDVLSVERSGV